MAGDWIKIKTDLPTDPAVIRISMETGLEADDVVGKLVRLWSWANTHLDDGHAPGVTPEWLDEFLECRGFSEALLNVVWLELDGDDVVIPKFDRHNGKSAKVRATARERKRRERSRGQKRHATDVTGAGHTSDREEKSREDITPPLNPPGSEADPFHPTWLWIQTRLEALGCFQAKKALEEAKSLGATPEGVVAVLEHAAKHPGAWGPGAIRNRVSVSHPGLLPDQGWPKPSEEYLRRRQASLEEEERKKSRERSDVEQRRVEAVKKVHDQLEVAHGSYVDSLTKDEGMELAERLFEENSFFLQMFRRQGMTGLARIMIMSRLADEEASEEPEEPDDE
tara:strand:- start:9407 stop:10420 length:1014 start_codon:yes stop_codon:yes gene_type:complete